MKRTQTNLFVPYRSLGQVCSSIPPAFILTPKLQTEAFLSCAIDNVILNYSIKPFRLHSVTNQLRDDVKCVAWSNSYLFAGIGNSIVILKRKNLEVLHTIYVNSPVTHLLAYNKFIVCVDASDTILVCNARTNEKVVKIESPESFQITALVQPEGFEHQVLFGSKAGRMRLVDVQSGLLIREFEPEKKFESGITVLKQSTALNVVAVGLTNGQIYLKNIKKDRIICNFRQDGPITDIAFRTDGPEIMATSNVDGAVALWDLEKRILIGQKIEMHNGPITSMNFAYGSPYLYTSGTDNKVVKWVLTNECSLPEVVKAIEGPAKPALILSSLDGMLRQFMDYNRENSMKSMGFAREVRKKDMSRARFLDVRLPPILRMENVTSRSAVWDDLICMHEDSPLISTWSSRQSDQGSHLLYHKRFKTPKYLSAVATSIFLSSCGNFVLIGSSSGHLDVFNIQNGFYKKSFALPLAEQTGKDSDDYFAHKAAVTGIAMDLVNSNVVSGAADGSLHFWSFNDCGLVSRVKQIGSAVVRFRFCRFNALLAVALEDTDIVIVDILCRRIARRFKNAHGGAGITVLEFSPNGKWLISADLEGFLKVWDLATSRLIDIMHCGFPCLGASFSEGGEYLVTCHETQRAVYIWANRKAFATQTPEQFSTRISLLNLETPVKTVSLPGVGVNLRTETAENSKPNESELNESTCNVYVIDSETEENPSSINENMDVDDGMTQNLDFYFREKAQISGNCVTLSGLPPTRWANLPNLERIRERNKPIEAPKKPENVPFFLPSVETLHGFEFEQIDDAEKEKENHNNSTYQRKIFEMETPWSKKLRVSYNKNESLIPLFELLKEMNVSAIDFQIRAFQSNSIFAAFLQMLTEVLRTRRDFELVQSYLATFLNIHHSELWSAAIDDDNEQTLKIKEEVDIWAESNNDDAADNRPMDVDMEERNRQHDEQIKITKLLEELLTLQKESWSDVRALMNANSSLVQWIKNALI